MGIDVDAAARGDGGGSGAGSEQDLICGNERSRDKSKAKLTGYSAKVRQPAPSEDHLCQ